MQLLPLAFADGEDSTKSDICILPICVFMTDFEKGYFAPTEIQGSEQPADLLTKHVPRDVMRKDMTFSGLTSEVGRAESAPTIDDK